MEVVVINVVKVYQPYNVEVFLAVFLYLNLYSVAYLVVELVVRVHHIGGCVVPSEVVNYLL